MWGATAECRSGTNFNDAHIVVPPKADQEQIMGHDECAASNCEIGQRQMTDVQEQIVGKDCERFFMDS